MSDTIQTSDTSNQNARTMPHSLEAEQALLGELLVNNDSLHNVIDFLQSEHFILPFHSKLFDLIQKKYKLNQLASPVTLKEYLDNHAKIGDKTAYEYAMSLTINAVTINQAASYAKSIHEMFLRRQLIQIGSDITNSAYDANIDLPASQQIELAEQALFHLCKDGTNSKGFIPFKKALKQAIDSANIAVKSKGAASGYKTYISSLDNVIGGLFPSDLIILAGRPGMGKTALATNIAYNIAERYKYNQPKKQQSADNEEDQEIQIKEGGIVGFFSLEMSAEQIATRIISEQTKISANNIRNGAITEDDFVAISQLTEKLDSLPLYIDDTGGASIAQISSRARRLKQHIGLDVIIIDYVQLVRGSKKSSDANRVSEITEITVGLKALAKELNVPIIALSQLSRQVEHRDSKKPQLADLRESGSIEQDADIVMFVYREAYYKDREKPDENTEEFENWQAEMDRIINKAEIILAKNRHGCTTTINLAFEPEYTRFYDLDRQHDIEQISYG